MPGQSATSRSDFKDVVARLKIRSSYDLSGNSIIVKKMLAQRLL
jgi:hypothetical protein